MARSTKHAFAMPAMNAWMSKIAPDDAQGRLQGAIGAAEIRVRPHVRRATRSTRASSPNVWERAINSSD